MARSTRGADKLAEPMLGDPPVRPDGLCATCLGERRPTRSRTYGGAAAAADPYCSTVCCRIWHGAPLPAVKGATRGTADEGACAGCGVPFDDFTPGCPSCVSRHGARLRAAALGPKKPTGGGDDAADDA